MRYFVLTMFCVIKCAFSAHWINSYEGGVPAGAIIAGYQNGQIMYVCRAWHDGELLPGKLDTRYGGCFVPYRGKERKQEYYDVAVGLGVWHLFRDGSRPVDAFQGGITHLGEILYVCRARVDGHLIPGKLHSSQGGCYIANASREHKVNLYEVLVY